MKLIPLRTFLGLCLAGPAFAQVAPTITQPPQPTSLSLGDKASLFVTAVGDPPFQYQWFRNGDPIANATNRVLKIDRLTRESAGNYSVAVSNAAGRALSDPAAVEVDTLFSLLDSRAFPAGDAFGTSWGDYDGDGFPDLLAGGVVQNQLYHNNGNGTFTPIVGSNTLASWTYANSNIWAPYWVDYDNDGILDVFVPTGGNPTEEQNQLFRGLGGGKFQYIRNGSIVRDVEANMDAVWGDFDGDGRLDLFATRVGVDFSARPQDLYWAGADGNFTKALSGDFASDPDRKGYGATAGDFNGDGLRDIAFCLGGGALMVYQNLGGRKFEPLVQPGGGSYIGSPAAADYDNDGDLDVFVTFARGTCHLLRNDGTGNFELMMDLEPVIEPGRSAAAAWGDFDNDGWLDLFVARQSYHTPDGDNSDSLFHNNGDGTFTRIEAGTLTHDRVDSWGAAWADMDNDGFLDLAVGTNADSTGRSSRLFRNSGNDNGWMLLQLVGTRSNRSGLGAKVRLKATLHGQAITQYREIGTGAGWSQNDMRAHFGLADATEAAEIEIVWPSGQKQTLRNVKGRQILRVVEPGGAPVLTMSLDRVVHLKGDAETAYAIETSFDLGTWTRSEGTVLTDANGAAEMPLGALPGSGAGAFVRAVSLK